MCFSLLWIFQVLAAIIVIGGLIAILNLLLPWALGFFGGASAVVIQVIKIIIGVIIALIILWLIYDVITCAMVGFPRMR